VSDEICIPEIEEHSKLLAEANIEGFLYAKFLAMKMLALADKIHSRVEVTILHRDEESSTSKKTAIMIDSHQH